VRFCRQIGCTGLSGSETAPWPRAWQAGASLVQFFDQRRHNTDQLSHKIFDTTLATLMDVRESLTGCGMEQAIAALSGRPTVGVLRFWCLGAVASDAQHKFFPVAGLYRRLFRPPHAGLCPP